MKNVRTEKSAEYNKRSRSSYADDDDVIFRALAILESRLALRGEGSCLSEPSVVKKFLRLHLAQSEREVFCVLLLDSQHRLIAREDLFVGTIDGAAVYPREVVKCALAHNAAAVIFAHNHPSGLSDPSQADKAITNKLVNALATVEIRVLDHFVIGAHDVLSFAESGLL